MKDVAGYLMLLSVSTSETSKTSSLESLMFSLCFRTSSDKSLVATWSTVHMASPDHFVGKGGKNLSHRSFKRYFFNWSWTPRVQSKWISCPFGRQHRGVAWCEWSRC